jgi:hypothetical protein
LRKKERKKERERERGCVEYPPAINVAINDFFSFLYLQEDLRYSLASRKGGKSHYSHVERFFP